MNTPTHMLAAAAVFSRRHRPQRNAAILFGALVPDLSIFVLFGWARARGIPQNEIWTSLYWQEPWQTISAISNSFPIWSLALVIGLATRLHLVMVVAAAVLIHLALDFPVHASDAHKHFWPLTDWRFHSPLSYWDTNHHSRVVMLAELALCIACIAVLGRRHEGWFVRGLLCLALISLAIVPLYFWLTLG